MTPEQMDAANAIVSESMIGETPEPQAQETPQEQMQEQPMANQPPMIDTNQPPALTPEMLREVINAEINPLREQLTAQNTPALTEEEAALMELKQRLGLDGIENENKALRDQLEQINQARQAERMANDVRSFKEGKPDNAEQIVMDELNRLAQTNPGLAAQFDNPEGWNYIYQAKAAASQPAHKPDPILNTGGGQPAPEQSAFDRMKKGESVSRVDLGMDILKSIQG